MSSYTRPDPQLASLSEKQLVSMRTASIERSVQLRHPVPGLESLAGAYVKNVVNLEDTAERMSMGSDIGEEIRKLQEEQKQSDSRRASLYSNAAVEPDVKSPSRNPSVSSYANSIVDVNNTARYGGYSPAAFVTSPIGSIRSGSWSQVSRQRSMSRGSRLGQLSNPDFDEEITNSPLNERSIPASARRNSLEENEDEDEDQDPRDKRMKRVSTGRMPSGGSFTRLYNQIAQENGSAAHLAAARIPSDTSFTKIYDQIAGEIRSHLDMPADAGQQNSSGSSLQPTPADKVPRQFRDVTPELQPEDPTPPRPPRHSYILPHVESTEFDGFTEQLDQAHSEAMTGQAERPASNNQMYADNLRPPDRPVSAASGDTFQQAQVLFGDFDGAHYAGSIRGSTRVPSGDPSELLNHDGASILRALDPPPTQAVPPPGDSMVFYPAPVPRTLNLPQRLSQLPPASVQAKRRTQLLESMPIANRNSVASVGQGEIDAEPSKNPRMSRPISQLPAQLRASVFFEQQSKREEVEIRDQSAVDTLDNLLDAAARAPVSAFTAHPMTGASGTGIYKRENATQSSASLQHSLETKNRKSVSGVPEEPEKAAKRKSSFFGLRKSSVSSANALDDVGKAPNRLRKRSSVTMSTALDDSALSRGPNGDIGGHDRSGATTPLRPRLLNEHGEEVELEDDEAIRDDHHEGEDSEGQIEDDIAHQYGPPTTLLAELQARKAQQKQRNRTFQSGSDGMHATLLELDAVAQLEKQKRQKTRVALAWEDPALKLTEQAEEEDEDDIPLGVLYGKKSKFVKAKLAERGLADWDRPLGLMERRQMEDNEPLSRRRNRLLGIDPNAAAAAAQAAKQSRVHVVEPESESEHEGETLKERIKRIKEKKALTDAIGDVGDHRVSHAFSVDMLGALGVEGSGKGDKRVSPTSLEPGDTSEHRESTTSLLPGATTSPDVNRKSFVPLSAAEMSKLNDKRKSSGPQLTGEEHIPLNTSGEEEEETLGQRRARLQREGLQRTKTGSQMSLGVDPRMNAMRPVSNMMPLADPRMSAMFPPQDPIIVRPTLAPSRSMADLLKAYPSGKNDARKVSNDMLLATLPQGSLLAQNEQEKQARSTHIKMTNGEGMGYQRTPSGNMMGGYQGQMPHQNGMMYPPQMPMAMGGAYGNMSNPNLMAGYQHPQMMGPNGYAAASQPNLLHHQQPMMSSTNLMGGYAGGGYANVGMNGGMLPVQHMPGSYQRQSSYGSQLQARVDEPPMEPPMEPQTRSRVDAWRQSVMP
ncbi:RNA-binding protein [Venturia nashicola]|nr:RNA-binding protein [Venturia nashicola]